MKAIVCCEESQIVCSALVRYGVDAYSNDLVDTLGSFPERHFKCDARELDFSNYDLVIAHPPCTYLSKAGKWCLNRDPDRYELVKSAVEFFMFFYNLDVPMICIENPVPMKLCGLPKYNQIIQPYQFGDCFSKQTCLWIRGLPLLVPDYIRKPEFSLVEKKRSARDRSRTSTFLADAMAYQWTHFL